MDEQFEYKNSLNQNGFENVALKFNEGEAVETSGYIDQIRQEMLDQYGWQSPYEYYYSNKGDRDLGVESDTILSLNEIDNFGRPEDQKIEAADKDNIPKYFWIHSISNWCYFKYSTYTPTFHHEESRVPGWLRATIAGLTFGISECIETIKTEGWGSWWKLPIHIISSEITPAAYYTLATINWIAGGGDLAANAKAVSLPFMLYNLITAASNNPTSDIYAEKLVEMAPPYENPGDIMMGRSCISLYMWNGYHRTWVPLKTLIEVYDRYCKAFSKGTYVTFLKVHFIPEILISGKTKITGAQNDLLNQFFATIPLTDDHKTEFRERCTYWKEQDMTDPSNINQCIKELQEILGSDVNQAKYANQMARVMVIESFSFDPWAFDFLTQRSMIDKKQIIGVYTGDSHEWGEWHQIENWNKYIPLSRDSAKLKQYSDRTFQLINRPYSNVEHAYRDNNGWIHRNIGHPCFFRGNDDQLWVCFWMRWTNPNGDLDRDDSWFESKSSMDSEYDISTDDIKNWDAIIDSMFEKHDEYGFDEWLANGDYGISYKKFTIDEESPTAIQTFEESGLNPDRVVPINTIDRSEGSVMTLRLSGSTVIGRDNGNGVEHIAKKWQ